MQPHGVPLYTCHFLNVVLQNEMPIKSANPQTLGAQGVQSHLDKILPIKTEFDLRLKIVTIFLLHNYLFMVK